MAASAAVAIACCIASARRLARAVAPTALDLALLNRVVEAGAAPRSKLAETLAGDVAFEWENAVFDAAREPNGELRGASLGELLTELDGKIEDGSRIPRVCASIATSAGFLCATAALLQRLSAVPDGEPVLAAEGLLVSSLGALMAGVAGATFCAAVHMRARRASRSRLAAAEALVSRLLEEPPGSGVR